MSNRAYQMPESLFKSEERREGWYLKSLKPQTHERKDGKWAPPMKKDLQALGRRQEEEDRKAKEKIPQDRTKSPGLTTKPNEEELAESVRDRMKNL